MPNKPEMEISGAADAECCDTVRHELRTQEAGGAAVAAVPPDAAVRQPNQDRDGDVHLQNVKQHMTETSSTAV